PRHLALVHEATTLFRGAGYTAFDGTPPEQRDHAAVAAPYAHVTAPLRRLVDRFGLTVCEAISRGVEVPDDVRAALPLLPDLMRESDRRAGAAERACADATEVAVLSGRVGEGFAAVVVDHTERGMEVQLTEVPVLARVTGPRAGLGASVQVRLEQADVAAGEARFVLDR
ncbi:MAG: RNB domain-containing ribonuclease, partial [Dermatophilaceae bacterium]